MQQASFAVMLQQSVDVAYGVNRESVEYTVQAANLAKLIEARRNELRTMSGALTNPYLACNTYLDNNEFIYGKDLTRDTYTGEDADKKHEHMRMLEGIQAGMKMAGMSFEELLPLSYEIFTKQMSKRKK